MFVKINKKKSIEIIVIISMEIREFDIHQSRIEYFAFLRYEHDISIVILVILLSWYNEKNQGI